MAYSNEPLSALSDFLPDNTFEKILPYLKKYAIQLSITKQRKSILGNYKIDLRDKINRISINGNLNKFSFLVTLVHEIAHCICFNTYGSKVAAHGKEWQEIYTDLLQEFVHANVFPDDLIAPLQKHISSPKASCSDIDLEKALDQYDHQNDKQLYIDELPIGAKFVAQNKKVYIVQEKRRTRFLCQEVETKKQYLFAAHYKILFLMD